MKTADTDGVLTREEAREILESAEVNKWGAEARRRARSASGNRVYYGRISTLEEVTEDRYDEVLLSDRGEVKVESVDSFVGTHDDTLEDHRDAHSLGVPTDVAVVYGDDALVERLAEVRELASEGGVRGVTLLYTAEDEPITTAYTDLKAVAVTRLFLPPEDVPLVRVARDEVGDKLAQTALEYGANDLGFLDEDDEKEVTIIGREIGLDPVERAEGFGGEE